MAGPAESGRQAVGVWASAVRYILDKVEYAAEFFDDMIYGLLEPWKIPAGAKRRKAAGLPADEVLRREIRSYIDSLVEGTDERLDRRFNERANRVEGENGMLKDLLIRKEDELSGMSASLERTRMEFEAYKSLQAEKDGRNAAVFRATEEELENLRAMNSGLEDANRVLSSGKADAVRQLGEMEAEARELRKVAAFRYGFDIVIPIIETGLYTVTGSKDIVYSMAAWLQKANKGEVPKEYIGQVLNALKEGGKGMHKNPRNKAFREMLKGDPARALDILREHSFPIGQ
jgi:hypothetical protein